MISHDPTELVEQSRTGDRRATARLISIVEESRPGADQILASLFATSGGAHVIGLTGPPGSGKSTITDRLISSLRARDDRVAVVAIDPSSPFTGGAILGDRIRMQDHVSDPDVYIRSLGTRGHLGGMSAAAPKVVAVLDGLGYPWILVETVGVGQAEVEIVGEADTTVVVVNPGWGDAVQANKAGLLEIADVFVVNKSDRTGVTETVRDLNQMLDLGATRPWRPPIVETVATEGDGIDRLSGVLLEHRAELSSSGVLEEQRRRRLEATMRRSLAANLLARAESQAGAGGYERLLDEVVNREVDPWTAARTLSDQLR